MGDILEGVVMEGKERFEYYFGTNSIKDNKTNKIYDYVVDLLNQQDKENQQLKQQLAENQKKKEDFKTMYFNKCLDYEHLHEKFDDKCAEFELKEYDYKQTIFEKDQEKISFAVEQLEKVKEKLLEELQNVTDLLDPLEYEDYHEFIGCGRGYKNSIEEIDNQINELKGEV